MPVKPSLRHDSVALADLAAGGTGFDIQQPKGDRLLDERRIWMVMMKKWVNLMLLVCLAASLVLSVACSGDSGPGYTSGWVGATPLNEALANGKPTVAEFGAATCVPCKAMKPILEGIVAEYDDMINLSFIDVRHNSNLTTRYKITLIPTQVFFDSAGQEVTRHAGYWSKEDVVAHLEELGFI